MTHLEKTNLTYWEHFVLGMQCNWYCFLALLFGLIHTIFPNLFPFTSYEYILKIRGKVKDLYKGE